MLKKTVFLLYFIIHLGNVDSSGKILTDKIYRLNIKSVLLYPNLNETFQPVIQLNSSDFLTLRFDDLLDDVQQYAYRIIHCNPSWEVSGISEFEYINGFNGNPIDDYTFSINTRVPYVNYSLQIPNEDVQLKISGNYILQVYNENDEDQIVFEKRFYVISPKVKLTGQVLNCSDVSLLQTHHDVNFNIKYDPYQLNDPMGNMKIFVSQNHRFDGILREVKPQFMRHGELVFGYRNNTEKTTFRAGLEFRFFNITNLNIPSSNVSDVYLIDNIDYINLYPDDVRENTKLLYDNDMNGGFFLDVKNRNSPHLEGDYVWVNFSLIYDMELVSRNVYVAGRFNDWKYNELNQMHYDKSLKMYTASILLKQGFYNYEYTAVGEDNIPFPNLFEGSDSKTENIYNILVYYFNINRNYYELIGWTSINSRQ